MKFVSNKQIVDYANELDAVQARIRRLDQQLKAARDEQTALVEFLDKKMKHQSFTFTPARGRYLKAVEFCPRHRKILDQKLARARLIEAGLKVPVKSSNWMEAVVRIATEDDTE